MIIYYLCSFGYVVFDIAAKQCWNSSSGYCFICMIIDKSEEMPLISITVTQKCLKSSVKLDKLRNTNKSHFPLCGLFVSSSILLSHCTVSPIPACFCWTEDSTNTKEKEWCFKGICWRAKLPAENLDFYLCSKFREEIVTSFWCYTHTAADEVVKFFTWVKIVLSQYKKIVYYKQVQV